MRLSLVMALVVSTPMFVVAQSASQPADVAKALEQCYAQWMTAFRQFDGATMDRMEAPDLTVLQQGRIWTKPTSRVEQFKALKDAKPEPETFTIESPLARIQGAIAVFTGVQVYTVPKIGRAERVLFTTVWKREGADWKVWSAHWSNEPATGK